MRQYKRLMLLVVLAGGLLAGAATFGFHRAFAVHDSQPNKNKAHTVAPKDDKKNPPAGVFTNYPATKDLKPIAVDDLPGLTARLLTDDKGKPEAVTSPESAGLLGELLGGLGLQQMLGDTKLLKSGSIQTGDPSSVLQTDPQLESMAMQAPGVGEVPLKDITSLLGDVGIDKLGNRLNNFGSMENALEVVEKLKNAQPGQRITLRNNHGAFKEYRITGTSEIRDGMAWIPSDMPVGEANQYLALIAGTAELVKSTGTDQLLKGVVVLAQAV
ncbi:hypothetical protein EI42_03818 [Thermosporothrix hazakensis]|jgi:hypothetical protein|uniref:Uncharacterized protein n=2 Tax=Thermosporothrix TaxID=768650 RepID=A0A326UGX5_THEHA|nr:hypothetical protein [Thermosporothrix hazakensis]PZW26666.1 hypothetical protein EI42_03818 [Thermosporothrix hazakensis]